MTTHFAGLRGTDSFGTGERPQNFRESILWMAPNGRAPLFALSARMKKEATDDPQFHWWEEVKDIQRINLNEVLTGNSDTTLTVADDDGFGNAFQFKPGDLLMFDLDDASFTNEIVKVTSVTDATTIVVTREYAGTTAAGTTADGTGMLKVGSAYEEGSGAPSSVTSNPQKYTNYTQIFKTPYEVTETAKNTYFRTGDPIKNDQIRKMFTHSSDIEQAFFWGKADEITGSGGQPERTMAGLRSMISSNVTIFAADPTLDTFIDAISPVFDYEAGGAGDERIVYAGNGALNFLNKLVASESSTRVQYNGVIDIYGQNLFTFRIPQGTIAIKSHPLFNVNPLYTYSMFVVNPMGLIYRPLKNRDTKIQKNIQANDEDKQKDQWLTECSLELHFERTFGYIGGFKDWP
jgi:hypothetical protein